MESSTEQLRQQLLLTLANGQFHSGTELGHQFGMSRSAIAQHITAIKEWGVDVFAVAGKGYRLAHPLALLNIEQLNRTLQQQCEQPPVVEYFPRIGSTNQYLLGRLAEKLDNGHTVVAEAQSQGRGRRGRQWHSPFASNIYLSMYRRLEQGIAAAMGLSLVVGVCVAQVLRRWQVPVQLKWPNDVLVNGQKLAGILVELQGQNEGNCDVVLGIGINVAMDRQQASNIDQPWADVQSVINQPVDRTALCADLIAELHHAFAKYDQQGFAPFKDEWLAFDAYAGQQVKIITGSQQVLGEAQGVTSEGGLLLKVAGSGEIKTYFGGEVSLRPVTQP